MRTTLTLDDDVAALLGRARKSRKTSLKEVVNEALRKGLKEITVPSRPSRSFSTKTVSLGRCLLGSVDDVAEVLAVAEEDSFK